MNGIRPNPDPHHWSNGFNKMLDSGELRMKVNFYLIYQLLTHFVHPDRFATLIFVALQRQGVKLVAFVQLSHCR